MSGQNNGDKWQQVAELIARLGLVPDNRDQPQTAAQVNRMTLQHLLQDPVRAAIYNRGWADRTVDIQRRLRPELPTAQPRGPQRATRQPTPSQPRPFRPQPPRQPPTTYQVTSVRGPDHMTPREPTSVPGTSGTPPTPKVKVRSEAQQAKIKRNLQQLTEKRKARKRMASQQHRLAKQPEPILDPEAASQPPSKPTLAVAMEVDQPVTKGHSSKEPGPSTSQVQPNQPTKEATSEDVWLAAPGLSLEGLPEMVYDNRAFFTPVGSPKHD